METGIQIDQSIYDFLNILGVTYFYNTDPYYFNIVPLLVSGTITVQLWTYTSRIYQMQTGSSLN